MLKIFFSYSFYLCVIYIAFIFFSSFFSKVNSLIQQKEYKVSVHFFVALITILQFLLMRVVQSDQYTMYMGAMGLYLMFFMFIDYLLFLAPYKIRLFLTFLVNAFLWFVCSAEVYVTRFKGQPFTINDLSAAKTAFSVASNYDFTPTFGIFRGVLLVFIIEGIVFIIGDNFKKKDKIIGLIISFILSVPILILFSVDRTTIEKMGPINIFDKQVAVSNYSYPLYLYCDYIFNRFEYPKDYSEDEILEKIDNIDVPKMDEDRQSAVNVICILDEAFYDLSLVAELDTNKDFLPFYHSDIENTLKGYTVVSTFGGGTANSEYEFLMQGNLRFLPQSSYPFSTYINKKTTSLASILKDRGFKTIAYHPYLRSNWNRNTVYPLIGFDEFLDGTSFKHTDANDYTNMECLWDKLCFEDIIDIYENKEENENLFIYTVTMQNHSPYYREDESSYLDIIREETLNSKIMNNYLSLMSLTDNAIEELFEYFDNVDEPTIICVFGDHAPGGIFDYDTVATSAEQKVLLHSTPFLIHTNFDTVIPETTEFISISYLQSIVMEMGNIEKDKEQVFIDKYRDKYPILNSSVIGDMNSISDDNYTPEDLINFRDYCYTKLNKK